MALATDYITAKAGISDHSRGFFADLFATMVRQYKFRQTFKELDALSDRQLADLGLKRSEIRRVAFQASNKA